MSGIRLDRVAKSYDGRWLAVDHVSLDVRDGEFLVLVGPSGCGKSTLLRMIAGLEQVTSGTIHIGERDVTDVAPPDRDIAMVFQNYALYPHKTVRENLAFGLRQRRAPKSLIAERVDDVAQMLGLGALLERKPGQLSGGQRQRVAIGRALVREPQAFLLDEPLSNLDAKLRTSMRSELSRLHERMGTTTVYVTHDQVEAMTLGQRVVVLRDGVVQQCDVPQTLFHQPANLFVAAFIGSPAMNLVEADVAGGAVRFGGHAVPLPAGLAAALGGRERAIVGIRPTAFQLAGAQVDPGCARLDVDVELVEHLGDETRAFFPIDAPQLEAESVRAASEDGDEGQLLADERRARFIACLDGRAGVEGGRRVTLALDPRELHVFDYATGETVMPQDAHAPAVVEAAS